MAFNVIKPHIAMNLQKSYLMKDSIDVTLESSLNKDDPIIIDTCVKKKNRHSESIAWQHKVPYRLHVFLEV